MKTQYWIEKHENLGQLGQTDNYLVDVSTWHSFDGLNWTEEPGRLDFYTGGTTEKLFSEPSIESLIAHCDWDNADATVEELKTLDDYDVISTDIITWSVDGAGIIRDWTPDKIPECVLLINGNN